MRNLSKQPSDQGFTRFVSRNLFIPEMIPPLAFIATMLFAWRRGVITGESIRQQPQLWGTIGGALVTTSSSALFGRWRENRDEVRSNSQENVKRIRESIEQCTVRSGHAIENGEFYTAEKKLLEAKQLFDDLFQNKDEPTAQKQYVELCYKIAYVMFQQKKYTKATEILDTLVLNLYKNHRDGLNLKGLILFKLGKFNDALKCFDISLSEDTNQNSIYLIRSLLKGNAKVVINHNSFDNISGDEPLLLSDSLLQQFDIMEIEGLAFMQLKQYKEAICMFLAAILTLPPKILYFLDKSYLSIKACEAAVLLREQQHNADFEIDTLDKKKVTINNSFIEKQLENAKERLAEYKDFDTNNPRIEQIQQLITVMDQKINPRQAVTPSL